MAKKITKSQNELMYYRQAILNDRLRMLNNLINGRNSSFYPFIEDKDGKASEKKVDKLISDLLKSLEHHFQFSGRGSLNDDTAEMYRCFLYCAMFGLKYKENPKFPSVSDRTFPKTFADITEFAESIESSGCKSYGDFLMLEYSLYRDNFKESSYFFDRMSESIRMLGMSFVKELPSEVQKKLCMDYAKENNISEEENEYYISDAEGVFESEEFLKWEEERYAAAESEWEHEDMEELERHQEEEFLKMWQEAEKVAAALEALPEGASYEDNEFLRNYTEEQIVNIMAEYDFYNDSGDAEALAHWRENRVNAARFFDSYNRFAELYFTINHDNMVNDIINMTDTFLFENQLSAFSFGEDYGIINHQLEKMCNQIKNEIKRSRNR